MKKNSIYALMSAIALAGSVGFSGCSSSDDVINNPDYNPETNSVKTEFAISLPNYVGASTRQTTAITQAQTPTATFRGMQNMVLIPFEGNETTPLNGKVFSLADIAGFDLDDQKAKVYKDLDVPINTTRFVFYGQATVTGNEFNNGKLNAPSYATVDDGTDDYNFTLEKIAPNYSSDNDTKGNAICAYLKSIRETEGITSTQLQSLLTGATGFKPIAASSASVQAAVQQLWDIVKTYNTADATGVTNIKSSILGNSLATISDAGVVTLTGDDLLGYPANLNLPDGAVTIDWQDPANPVINGETLLNVAGLKRYVYPAALYYRANSNIGVSDEPNVSESYDEDTWATISASNLYDWDGTVGTSTRSIALKDQIQYAVGRLDLTVKAANATLYDGDGVAVDVAEAGFPVSAVLIGGQKDVGFDFTPNGNYTYTIYDKTMNGTVAAKAETAQGTNHTLVLETAPAATTVNVAVEMTNNTGHAFKGKDGTVPANGKFYLVGELNLAAATGVTHPDPQNPRTKIFEQDYVTKVNFTITQGTFEVSNTTGLGAAYNVLPDLTVSQLEVAFSVDLTWIPGITFDVNL